jgi:hypothetical protein
MLAAADAIMTQPDVRQCGLTYNKLLRDGLHVSVKFRDD